MNHQKLGCYRWGLPHGMGTVTQVPCLFLPWQLAGSRLGPFRANLMARPGLKTAIEFAHHVSVWCLAFAKIPGGARSLYRVAAHGRKEQKHSKTCRWMNQIKCIKAHPQQYCKLSHFNQIKGNTRKFLVYDSCKPTVLDWNPVWQAFEPTWLMCRRQQPGLAPRWCWDHGELQKRKAIREIIQHYSRNLSFIISQPYFYTKAIRIFICGFRFCITICFDYVHVTFSWSLVM